MSPAPTTAPVAHRLQLPRATAPEDVLTMVRNVRPEAELADGVLDLGDGSRMVADEGRRGAGRWTLESPSDREEPTDQTLPDSHGYHRAFPDGVPFGTERDLLDLGWSLARRLGGAVVTADGNRLEPHPCHVRNLTVVSPYALAPESFLELLQGLEPGAVLDEVPEGVPHVGYSAVIDLEQAGQIVVEVGRSSRPVALREATWLDEAVDYTILHEPVDEAEDAVDIPDGDTAERWAQVYGRIALIAGLLVEGVGGVVLDAEGFLVDPAHLA